MTRKLNIDNGLQSQATEHQPVTAAWRNGGIQCWLTVLHSETRPNAKPETVDVQFYAARIIKALICGYGKKL